MATRPADPNTTTQSPSALTLPPSVQRDIARLPNERARAQAREDYIRQMTAHLAVPKIQTLTCRDLAEAYGIQSQPAPTIAAPAYTPQKMNKTEARFAFEWLEPRKSAGEIVRYWFEPMKLRLPGDRLTYTPDFLVRFADGRLELFEVKGFPTWKRVYEDAWIKVKLCRAEFPQWPLTVACWCAEPREFAMEEVA